MRFEEVVRSRWLLCFLLAVGVFLFSPGAFACGQYLNDNFTMTTNLNCADFGFNINASNIVLDCDGFTLNGTSAKMAINITSQENITIKDCTVTTWSTGAAVLSSDNVLLNNSHFSSASFTLFVNDNDNFTMSYGSANSSVFAVSISNATNSKFLYNSFNSSLADLVFEAGSHDALVQGNNFLVGLAPQVFIDSDRAQILDNIFSESASDGLRLDASSNATVRNNTFSNRSLAILANFSNYLIITQNRFVDNSFGINLTACSNGTYTNNTFLNQQIGIQINSGSENDILFNNFTNSTTVHAYSVSSGNNFYDTFAGVEKGNFWDDVASLNILDFDGDGFGDSGSQYPYNPANFGKVLGFVEDQGPIRGVNVAPAFGSTQIATILLQENMTTNTLVLDNYFTDADGNDLGFNAILFEYLLRCHFENSYACDDNVTLTDGAPFTVTGSTQVYFPMNETTGELASDVNAVNLTPVGEPNYTVAGKFGTGVYFNGSSDLFFVNDGDTSGRLDFSTSDFTVHVWVYMNTSVSQTMTVLGKRGSGTGAGYQLEVTTQALPLVILSNGTGAVQLTGTTVLNDSTFHLVSFVLDNNTLQLYVDGTLENSTTFTGDVSNALEFSLGARSISGLVSQHFTGILDELAVLAAVDTNFNLPTFSSGHFSQGVNVDQGDLVTFPSSSTMPASTGTLGFWITLGNNWETDGTRRVLFDSLGMGQNGILIEKNSSDYLVVDFSVAGTNVGDELIVNISNQSASWASQTQHHIALAWNTSDAYLYLDGSLVVSDNTTGALTAFNETVAFGNDLNGTTGSNTTLDELFIVNRTYNATEISQKYNFTHPVLNISFDNSTGIGAFTPESGFSGSERVYFEAVDPAGLSGTSNVVTLVVAGANAQPFLNNSIPTPQLLLENTSIFLNLSQYFADPDGDTLTYSAHGHQNVTITINQTTTIANITPDPGFIGNDSTNFTAIDPFFANVSSGIIELFVAFNNTAPVLSSTIPDRSFVKNTTNNNVFDLNSYFTDADGNTLTYSVTGNTNITVSISGSGIVSVSAGATFTGTETVTFSASDGINTTASNSVDFTFAEATTNSGNNAPARSGGTPRRTIGTGGQTTTPTTATNNYECGNGIDDDNDGRIDLEDPDCASRFGRSEGGSGNGTTNGTGTPAVTFSTFTSNVAVACTPSWSCTDWSTCANDEQTRTCTDDNICNSTSGKPAETQACTVTGGTNGGNTGGTGGNAGGTGGTQTQEGQTNNIPASPPPQTPGTESPSEFTGWDDEGLDEIADSYEELESKGGSLISTLLLVLVGLVAISGIAGGGYYLVKTHQERNAGSLEDLSSGGVQEDFSLPVGDLGIPGATSAPSETDKALSEYVHSCQAQGFSTEQIREQLQQEGWDGATIDNALVGVSQGADIGGSSRGVADEHVAGVRKYIDQMRAEGYDDNSIREGLQKEGWGEDVLTAAFAGGSLGDTGGKVKETPFGEAKKETHSLQTYIKKMLTEGFSEEEIKTQLKNEGWAEQDVKAAFDKHPQIIQLESYISDMKKQGYLKEEIGVELRKEGWNREDISAAFEGLDN